MAVPNPIPIRQTCVNYLRTKLSEITTANGYTYNVTGRRVFLKDIVGPNVEVPSIFVVQRTESVRVMNIERHKLRRLVVNIGFCAEYNGMDPDQRAALFVADIERALPYTDEIDVYKYEDQDNPSAVTVKYPIKIDQNGSAMNIAEPIDNRVFGQVDYVIEYVTSLYHPCFL